jgi:hypothetical protein
MRGKRGGGKKEEKEKREKGKPPEPGRNHVSLRVIGRIRGIRVLSIPAIDRRALTIAPKVLNI